MDIQQGGLPGLSQILRDRDSGMTHLQIARKYGVSRSAVSVALHRAGVASQRARYEDLLPWRVSTEHVSAYAARMLRLEASRRAGKTLAPDWERRLDSWLDQLNGDNEQGVPAVVAYSRTKGFEIVQRRPSDDDIIRRPKVREQQMEPGTSRRDHVA